VNTRASARALLDGELSNDSARASPSMPRAVGLRALSRRVAGFERQACRCAGARAAGLGGRIQARLAVDSKHKSRDIAAEASGTAVLQCGGRRVDRRLGTRHAPDRGHAGGLCALGIAPGGICRRSTIRADHPTCSRPMVRSLIQDNTVQVVSNDQHNGSRGSSRLEFTPFGQGSQHRGLHAGRRTS